VLGAIAIPCPDGTRQTGSTPNTCLCASMNATSAAVAGRARPQRKPTPPWGSHQL